MKRAIFSDLHSRSPMPLLKEVDADEFVFLGDYDEPELLEEILNLKTRKIVLIGNHDYAWVHGEEITSPYLLRTPEDYFGLWKKFSGARRFVLESAGIKVGRRRGLTAVEKTGAGKIVYVHAGLNSNPVYDNAIPELWDRLVNEDTGEISPSKVRYNFRQMQKKRHSIMFRGHDNLSAIFSLKKWANVFDFVCEKRRAGTLERNRRYIISVGAFKEGEYLLFDDTTLAFEFRNCDS